MLKKSRKNSPFKMKRGCEVSTSQGTVTGKGVKTMKQSSFHFFPTPLFCSYPPYYVNAWNMLPVQRDCSLLKFVCH